MKHFNIPIFISHLGCPYQCIYCDQKKIATSQVPEPNQVQKIIEDHLQTIPVNSEVEVAFFGGNFTDIDADLQEAYLKAVEPYILAKKISGIRLSTRPDSIDEEGLERLKNNHVNTIELGVQSLCDEVLKASSRGYTADVVFKSSQLVKEWGFQLGVQLMIGLPGDHFELDIATVQSTIEINPAMVRIYPTLVIAGTALETLYQKGAYQPLSLENAVMTCREMFLRLEKNNIPVIRMGLHPGEDLRSEGVIVTGPFHPAFGELVEQSIFLEQASMVLQQLRERKAFQNQVVLFVNPRDVSKMAGLKRNNIKQLQSQWNLSQVTIQPDSGIKRNEIGVSQAGEPVTIKLKREAFIKARNF
ncbi:MAG: radical SAM protein [Bacillota bacterium]|nr:radical SAM protein [Bacillota bacterium]